MIQLLTENVNTPLRVYFHSLYFLGIILNLEFHILAKLLFTDIHKRILDPIRHLWMEFLLRNLSEFEPTGPKILLVFLKISLRMCALITLKVHNSNLELLSLAFYDHNVCVPWCRLYMIFNFMSWLNFFLVLWDNLVNLAWI